MIDGSGTDASEAVLPLLLPLPDEDNSSLLSKKSVLVLSELIESIDDSDSKLNDVAVLDTIETMEVVLLPEKMVYYILRN